MSTRQEDEGRPFFAGEKLDRQLETESSVLVLASEQSSEPQPDEYSSRSTLIVMDGKDLVVQSMSERARLVGLPL